MELMERLGGLGRVRMLEDEQKLRDTLLKYTSAERNEALRVGDSYTKYAQDKSNFRNMMRALFPSFPLTTDSYGGFNVIDRDNTYSGLNECRERVIGSSLPIGEVGQRDVELRIILSAKEPETFMTIALHSLYQRSTDDELVDLLGLRESPSIVGAAPIYVNDTHEPTRYGIADVPALGKVLQAYERARERIQKVYTHTGITPDQLNVLHRDSLQHENIAIRELSTTRYRNVLNTLAIKG